MHMYSCVYNLFLCEALNLSDYSVFLQFISLFYTQHSSFCMSDRFNVLRLCRIPADVFIYLSSLEPCKFSVSTECEVPGAWLSHLR